MPASWATAAQAARLEWLLRARNRDGGWGYGCGKASWLEPTVYALRALQAGGVSEPDREARQYIDRLQRPDGSWQASAAVPEMHWSGALWLGLTTAPRDGTARWQAGLRWLLAEQGSEGGWGQRLGAWLDPHAVEEDVGLRGWPWLAGTSSWVEPTCHALLALRRASDARPSPQLAARLAEGQRLLFDRRCRDGGWNYGNRRVRDHDLPGYPETTALALLALQRCGATGLEPSVARARKYWEDACLPRVARVWLALALRQWGLPAQLEEGPLTAATITVALEAVAASPGGFA